MVPLYFYTILTNKKGGNTAFTEVDCKCYETCLHYTHIQSCVYGENRTSIQCTTPSLAKLALPPPVVTKVAFILDGYATDQWDLIYVEDPLFQDPKLTSKDNKSVVELKVRPDCKGLKIQHPEPVSRLR